MLSRRRVLLTAFASCIAGPMVYDPYCALWAKHIPIAESSDGEDEHIARIAFFGLGPEKQFHRHGHGLAMMDWDEMKRTIEGSEKQVYHDGCMVFDHDRADPAFLEYYFY